MRVRMSVSLFLLITGVGLFVSAHDAAAANAVAKITSFKGEVVILSDTKLTAVTQAGPALNEGDSVQTKQGEAEVTFNDGSVMKLNPFTNAMIQEREEESGWWLFKSRNSVRRLTVFVGKLWFKSGASQKKNYLQTPTAVCGLRGSESELGYDNVKSFLNVIAGGADTIGQFVRGEFENPGMRAAVGNQVYQALVTAQQAYNTAQQTGATRDMAQAELSGLQVLKTALQALQSSPDPEVARLAGEALQATEVRIQEKQQQIDQMPTTTGGTTTSAGGTTTSAAATTTSSALTTTSIISESTTSRAEQTTTIALPTLPPTTMRPTTISTTTTTSIAPTTTTTSATTTTTTSRRSPF